MGETSLVGCRSRYLTKPHVFEIPLCNRHRPPRLREEVHHVGLASRNHRRGRRKCSPTAPQTRESVPGGRRAQSPAAQPRQEALRNLGSAVRGASETAAARTRGETSPLENCRRFPKYFAVRSCIGSKVLSPKDAFRSRLPLRFGPISHRLRRGIQTRLRPQRFLRSCTSNPAGRRSAISVR